MSCCMRLDTPQILANVFHEYREPLTLKQLQKYVGFMFEAAPVYLISDLSLSEIQYAIEKYPNLYVIQNEEETVEDNVLIQPIGGLPNLEYFNSIYSISYASFIERATRGWVQKEVLHS